MRAALVYLTCFNLVVMPVANAEGVSWAENPGATGSITIGTKDPNDHSRTISDKFHYGDQAHLEIHARDGNGVEVPCERPTFERLNDFGGEQIAGVNGRTLVMGNSLGEARLRVRCEGLPGVVGELHVYNMKKMVPHKFTKPVPPGTPSLMQPVPSSVLATDAGSATTSAATSTAPPAGEAAAAGGGDAGKAVLGAVLGVGIAVGVAALVIGASKSSSPCTPPELACGGQYDKGCCPAGYQYICVSPGNVAGCYQSIFITGCSEKYFCGSDY